jgi:hypothetical protein
MAINQGLKSLAESQPNFSNQAVENAVNSLKIGWVTKSYELDTTISNNTVLTTSQKTDLKSTINNIAYLNAGRYLGDLVRHTASIIDGSIVSVEADVDNPTPATFLEIVQQVLTIKNIIPELYGVSASVKGKSINDHLGTLNGKFIDKEFKTLLHSITFINNASLSQDTDYQTAIDNLKNFVANTRDDSTDFQQTLDTFASAVASAAVSFDNVLKTAPYDVKRTQMIADRDVITTQINLENSNLVNIRSYVDSLTDISAWLSLAGDEDIRPFLINVTQNSNWKNYFENYTLYASRDNPIYNNTQSDSSNVEIINSVLRMKGLPDVTDYVDLDSVARKALRDVRLQSKLGNSGKTTEQIIKEACELLSISIDYKDVYAQSKSLLSNMNENDREIVKQELDLHNEVNTLS